MGLDMYLSKKTYVKNWNHTKPEERYEIQILKGGQPENTIKPERINYIEEGVGYWRKFNALHAWFVENCQDGVDDCRDAYVSNEKFKELLSILKQIDDDHSLAEELLPTTQGFFFGSDEYDEYYFEEISRTIEIMEALLLEDENAEFVYQSSW